MDILERLQRMPAWERAQLPGHLTLEDQQRLLERKTGKAGNRRGAFPLEPFAWTSPGRTLHLILPGYLPPSLNRYARDKRVRMSAVPEAIEQIEVALLESGADSRCFWRPVLEIRLVFPATRRRDGRTNWTKVLEDALVDSGLMVDDSAEWCETREPVLETDPMNPRTEITLTEQGSG